MMTGAEFHSWPWKTAMVMFALSVLLIGRKLDFHGFVHDDEPNKVTQITQQKYNFNHPLLMLRIVKWYAQAAGISDSYDLVIRAGRWSSVILSALAIAFFVLVCGRLHGTLVGAAAGIFILTTPIFFELAHYFKEDPALIFGLGLSLLAMQIYSEKPTFFGAAILGSACGIAISAKYAGLVIVPFAVFAVLTARRKADVLALLLAAVVVFSLINWPMVTAPEVWKSRVDLEVSRLQADNVPNRRSIPHGVYFSVFGANSSPVVLGLLVVYAVSIWRRKFHLPPPEWTILLLPVLYLLALSFIPTTSNRYVLPASVLTVCAAAAGLLPMLAMRHGKSLAVSLIVVSVTWQAPRLYAEDAAFSARRHADVLEFIRTQLPPSAAVLADDYNSLGPAGYSHPSIKQRTLQPSETLESMRKAGFTHILITSRRYPAFSVDSRKASGLSKAEEERMRNLYEAIFGQCHPIFEWKAGEKRQLEPEFRLYQLP